MDFNRSITKNNYEETLNRTSIMTNTIMNDEM